MSPRILNLRAGLPLGAIRVDRKGPWGNPFVMRHEALRDIVCDAFEAWAMHPDQAAYRERARLELAGKDLACWCAPKRCHAETLRRIANAPDTCCHDHDCVRRDECGHYMRDLEGDRHIATGRSGGACDLESFGEDERW